ncbi:hypothetical protein HMPREF0083_01127 [Aneurinibacillus aneurinilyticus ATCC 12856]|uniref:Uncharacterized protein n=1 Tax=Aneurinibacillus aneurinilyticus ATCC 12856 TaxID=649747 RepID=U1X8E8_ANEAE|nr:hypothetical protein HMPREF0083_01127 [Aneurinibacillus aneurinilyticus ATCC 12856]
MKYWKWGVKAIKEIQGELEEVFPDYILVNMDGQHYHVRWEGIVYI